MRVLVLHKSKAASIAEHFMTLFHVFTQEEAGEEGKKTIGNARDT